MDTQAPPYLFKETRINFDSALPNSTVFVRLPGPGASRLARASYKRPAVTEVAPTADENAFRLKHLASAASIYHRRHHGSPRSFHWRVLEEGKALSVTAADLRKHENEPENPLTLRLFFPSPIRPGCIALTDAKEHDALSVFALTESNHLYTLTLHPDFFRRRAATEGNVGDWCKIYLSSAFSFKYPHRLVAPRHREVLISLHDGGLLRLSRQPGEDASAWKETFYNEGGWAHGLKSLIPFQGSNTIRFGKVNIELSAGTAIVAPEKLIDGDYYAFTVSLDHRIRVWNLDAGKIAFTGDILGVERPPTELGKWVVHPLQSQLLRVIEQPDESITIVTFSPHGAGEFKFWNFSPNSDGTVDLIDMFPDSTLVPPSPTSDIWTLADFSTVLHSDERGKISLWTLWKNNITYRVQTVDLQLFSPASTDSSWRLSWAGVSSESLPDTPLPAIISTDPEDSAEKWLKYILYPGRFTIPTIETALSIYERSLGSSKVSLHSSKSLAERICSLIGSTVILSTSNGQADYDLFKTSVDAQWRRFYRLIVELDKQRGEAFSLSLDSAHQLPTAVTADGLAVVRDCSSLERLWHNPDNTFGGKGEAVSQLISAAASFRESFPDALQHACMAQVRVELSQESSLTDTERLQLFYDQCNFAGLIVDEDFNQLLANLGGSFSDLSVALYGALLSAMTAEDFSNRLERLPLASFGRKVVVKGVQEVVELHHSICLDQLVLLAFIEGEIDQEEEGMNLDTSLVHRQLLNMLKRLEILKWLSETQIAISPLKGEGTGSVASIADSPSSKKQEETKTVTILEGTLNHLLGLAADSGASTSYLTELLIRLCDPNSDIEIQPALIQAFLLRTEHPDLAASFSRFCLQDPFSTYIQGRTSLACKDLPSAATLFKKAAFGLGMQNAEPSSTPLAGAAHLDQPESNRHSSGLLTKHDWNDFNAGLPAYYTHIISLFDAVRSHSYIIDFARLALQFLPIPRSSDSARDREDDARMHGDLLTRLFQSALHTARYDIACSALLRMPDRALQANYLRALVYGLCEGGAVAELLELPWLGCEEKVDEVLGHKCRAVVDVNAGVPWHMVLYAWRVRRGNFRGAATVAYERLQKLQLWGNSGAGGGNAQALAKMAKGAGAGDELDTPVTRQFLQVINALSCVEAEQAWILAEPVGRKGGVEKRRIVTLEGLRKGLQDEMDRVEALKRGRFSFAADEDVEMTV